LVVQWIKFHDLAKTKGDSKSILLSIKAEKRVKEFLNKIGNEN